MEGETPKVYDEKEVTARKQHVCCECGGWIERGEKYVLCKGIWSDCYDGWTTFKVCQDCDDLRDELSSNCNEGVAFESVYEEAWEAGFEFQLWFWEILIKRGSFRFESFGEGLTMATNS